MQAMIHMCRSEDNSVEAILFLHVVLGIKCKVLGLHSNKSFTWPKYFNCGVTVEIDTALLGEDSPGQD